MVDSSKQAIDQSFIHSINQAETRNTGGRCVTKADRERAGESGGRERETERQITHTHTHGAHTNDKHSQGDEIKILSRRLGTRDVAIGDLRLVMVRRNSNGLRGRLGRHSGGQDVLRQAKRVLDLETWRACAHVHATNAHARGGRPVVSEGSSGRV